MSHLSDSGLMVDAAGTAPERRTERLTPKWAFPVVAFALAIQFVVIVAYSAHQYTRFDLSTDFATANQAAWLISHGDLNPWSSVHSYLFLNDHLALIIYPVSMLYWIYPHGTLLLWLQDAAGVAAELIAALWIVEIIERYASSIQRAWIATALALGAVVIMLANPWFYVAMFFDFHTEAFATLFLVLATRAAWHHRSRWAIAWVVALLLCGDLGGLYLCGLGLSLLIAIPRRWWWGAGGILIGYGWIRFADALGVSKNSFMTGYAYLQTGNPLVGANVSLTSLLGAIVAHPHRWLSTLWERRRVIYENLIPTGILALISPWSIGITLVVIVSSALIYPLVFLQSGFQNLPAYIVGICGTVLVLCWMGSSKSRNIRIATIILGVLLLAQSVAYGIAEVPKVPSQWITVSAKQAGVLNRALQKTPSNAEVVADWGVMGRFSSRRWIYNLYPIPGTVPINAKTVEFIVVPNQATGDEPFGATTADKVLTFLKAQPHMAPLAIGHGIYVYAWHPPADQKTIAIP